jgi:hypothetical protein
MHSNREKDNDIPAGLRDWIRLDHEPRAGDCALGTVLSMLLPIAKMFPDTFDIRECPLSPAEIRATMAVRMVQDFRELPDGTPADDQWTGLFLHNELDPNAPGHIAPWVLRRRPHETALNQRKRLALTMAYAESNNGTSTGKQPIIWLPPDVIENLLLFYLDRMYIPKKGRTLSSWLKPPTGTCRGKKEQWVPFRPCMALGPFCITTIKPDVWKHHLCEETWPLYKMNFAIISVLHNNHYKTYINRDVVAPRPFLWPSPAWSYPVLWPSPAWKDTLFKELYAFGHSST